MQQRLKNRCTFPNKRQVTIGRNLFAFLYLFHVFHLEQPVIVIMQQLFGTVAEMKGN